MEWIEQLGYAAIFPLKSIQEHLANVVNTLMAQIYKMLEY